jgi:hypothetical protein
VACEKRQKEEIEKEEEASTGVEVLPLCESATETPIDSAFVAVAVAAAVPRVAYAVSPLQ